MGFLLPEHPMHVTAIILFIIALGGWVSNIIQLAYMSAFTGLAALKAIGIIVAPLGALMGIIGWFN